MMRKKLSYRSSVRNFRRTANRVHRRNFSKSVISRGGTWL